MMKVSRTDMMQRVADEGVSPRKVARLADVHDNSVYHIFNSDTELVPIQFKTVVRLAKYFGCSVNELVVEEK